MKSLKRSLALLLTFTMLISALSVGVFAAPAETDQVGLYVTASATGVGQGRTVKYTFVVKALGDTTVKGGIAAIGLDFDSTKYTAAITKVMDGVLLEDDTNVTTEYVGIMYDGKYDITSTGIEVMEVTFTVKADAATGSVVPFTYNSTGVNIQDKEYNELNLYKDEIPTLNILKAFTVNAIDAVADKNVEVGTTLDQIKSDLSATNITVKGSDVADAATLTTAEWTSEDFVINTVKTEGYTFKGMLPETAQDGLVTIPDDKREVTVKVKVNPIATGYAFDEVAGEIVIKEEAFTQDEIKDVLKDVASIGIKKGSIEDTVAVTWTDVKDFTDGNYEVDNEITVNGKVAKDAASANGLFKLAETEDVKVTAKITVIPNNIENGTIKANNVGASSKGKVTVTVPAAAIAKLTADDEIVAKFFAYDAETKTVGEEKGSSEARKVEADEITAATGEDGKDLTVTLTTAEKMKDLGLGGGTEFAVKVYVDGTLLLNGDTDEYVTAKVLNVSNSPATGIPSGNGGNSGNKDDKKDDAATTPNDDKKDDTTPTPDDDKMDDTTPGTDAPATGFNDVPADHWAADFIKVLADAGIINGDEDGNFNTEGKITRAEFTKMVAVLFGLEIKDDATVDFSDCGEDDWFVKYVAAAVEAGYINGVGEGTFAPNDTISREDACTILGRALGLAAENANLNFADADAVADYAAQYIALLSELGFINGYEDGTFAPKNEITRAEAAKIIAGIYADKNAAANAGDNTEAEAETETETDAEAEVEEEVEAEK